MCRRSSKFHLIMRRTIPIIINLLWAGSILCISAAEPSFCKEDELRVKGTIVGFDSLASAGNITYAPQSQLLVVRINKTISGREQSRYIIVVYEYFASEDKFLPDLVSGNKKRWEFMLSRRASCDNPLMKIRYAKGFSLDGKEIFKVLRLEDTGGLDDIPESKILPCYEVTTNGLKPLRR